MKTFTKMKEDAANFCGLYTDAREMTKIIDDIQTGVKLFQNAARRYWTRKERKTNLVAGKQYYQFPSDMMRVSSIRVKVGERLVPLEPVNGEDVWDTLNNSPASGTPQWFFIKGSDELGLYPVPSNDVVDGLFVTFEPRMVDMSIDDVKLKVKVIENSNVVEAVGTFNQNVTNDCWFTVTDGTDGNWYKISKWIDPTHIWIDNNYQGRSGTRDALIGQCVQFPEEYHAAPVHYACQQFFTLRKDLESASFHGQQFDKLLQQYKDVYGGKRTGTVLDPPYQRRIARNVFPGILRG